MINKKILFFEPHNDDFILSAGGLLFLENDITLVTVFENIKNNKSESKKLAEDFTLKHYDLKLKIHNFTGNKQSIIKEIILMDDYDLIITTAGCGHFDHLTLFKHLSMLNYDNTLYVRDFPHSYRRVNTWDNYKQSHCLEFVQVVKFNPEKVRLFDKYYKSQKMLLFYEKKYFEGCYPEEYFKINKQKYKGVNFYD